MLELESTVQLPRLPLARTVMRNGTDHKHNFIPTLREEEMSREEEMLREAESALPVTRLSPAFQSVAIAKAHQGLLQPQERFDRFPSILKQLSKNG